MPPKTFPSSSFLLLASRLRDPAASRIPLCRFLSAAAEAQDSIAKPHFMVEHLVAACGFSPSEATKVSKRLARFKSPAKPNAVLGFLDSLGLDSGEIRTLITSHPDVLASNVEKTLKPKVQTIRDLGFTGAEVSQLILANPSTLRYNNIGPKIEFLRSQLPQKEDLLKALRRDSTLLNVNLEEIILPNLALLRDYGVPEERIATALVGMPRLLSRKADSFRELVEQTMAFGFDCGSPMFLHALYSMARMSKKTLEAKRLLLLSYGWSDDDFVAAFRKDPIFLTHSKEGLRTSMNFLLQEVGCDLKYIAANPKLLQLSFQRRLVPRFRVLQILKSEGLPGGERNLLSVVSIPHEKFYNVYVAPQIEKVPALRVIYQSAAKLWSDDASAQEAR